MRAKLKRELQDAIQAIESDPQPPPAEREQEPPADELVNLQADPGGPMLGPNEQENMKRIDDMNDKLRAQEAKEMADELDTILQPNAPPLHPYRCRKCGRDVEQHTAWAPCPHCGQAFHG